MKFRAPIIILAGLSLIAGLLTGELRIGWDISIYQWAGHHGAMMLGGFLGTLICLERAVVLKSRWAYLVPVTSGLSFFAFGANQVQLAYVLLIAAAVGLIAIYIAIIQLKKAQHMEYLLIGAICWLAGNVLLLQTQFYPIVFPWWMAFILFTIVGERLELTRFLPVKKYQQQLLVAFLLITLLGFMLPYHGAGRFVAGAGIACVAIWLIQFDVARLLLKKKGHFLFTGSALYLGYCWLLIAAVLMIINASAPLAFDALIHAFFLGFTFSMIFAHGPIIFPGILGKTTRPYHPILFAWLALLHSTLLLRIVADFLNQAELRRWAGMFNGVSIVFFLITIMYLMQKERYLS